MGGFGRRALVHVYFFLFSLSFRPIPCGRLWRGAFSRAFYDTPLRRVHIGMCFWVFFYCGRGRGGEPERGLAFAFLGGEKDTFRFTILGLGCIIRITGGFCTTTSGAVGIGRGFASMGLVLLVAG